MDPVGQRAVEGGGQGHGHPHVGALVLGYEPAGRGPGTGYRVRGLPQCLRRGTLGDPQVPVRVGQGQQPPEPDLCPDDVHDAAGECVQAGRVLGAQRPSGRVQCGQSRDGLAAVRTGGGVRVRGRRRVPPLFPDPAEQSAAWQHLITRERGHVGGGWAGAGPVGSGRSGRPRVRVV